MRMLVAFFATGMFAIMACKYPARADALATLQAAQAADARRDYATELTLLRPLAEQGNAIAQGVLGVMYDDGLGVPQDYAEAFRWFRKAAEQGNVAAQGQLGSMYANGRGVPRDDAEAVRWSRKAAEHENAKAQFFLGAMYDKGRGVPQDDAEAVRWYRKAAQQGNSTGQALLGTMLEDGRGIPRDYVQAYMWYNLAAAGGANQAAHWRDGLERKMTAQQIAEAQQRTAAWRPVQGGEQQVSPIKPAPEAASGQLGTAFFIGEGLLLTNAHVVKGCLWVGIPNQGGSRAAKAKREYWDNPDNWDAAAQVVARDDDNDLALLSATIHPPAVAALRLSVRQGEAIAAYGFPLRGLLASGGNLTTGNITALSGIGDDSRLLQISAPVQPGNSGGPLLDGGNVVGIVESKLNAIKVAAAVGDVPQNVNFAIKASVVATFLDSNNIHYASGVSAADRSPADIAENARRFTVPVECSGSAH